MYHIKSQKSKEKTKLYSFFPAVSSSPTSLWVKAHIVKLRSVVISIEWKVSTNKTKHLLTICKQLHSNRKKT